MTITKTRLFTSRSLKAVNSLAISNKFNRALSDDLIKRLDPDGFHVVDLSFVHNDDHIRVSLMIKVLETIEPVSGYVDMTFEDYERYSIEYEYDPQAQGESND